MFLGAVVGLLLVGGGCSNEGNSNKPYDIETGILFDETVPGELNGQWVATVNYFERRDADGVERMSMVLIADKDKDGKDESDIIFPDDMFTIGNTAYKVVWIKASGDKPGESMIAPVSTQTEENSINKETLIGFWQTISGSSYQDILIEADGTFISRLNNMPFASDTWEYANGVISLKGGFPEELTIVSFVNDVLTLKQPDGVMVEWKKIQS